MSQDAVWLPSEIADQLTELKSWVRWQWLLRGAGRVGMIASLGLAGAFVADYRYDLAPTTRIAVLSSVVAVTLIAFLAWVVVPLCRRIGWAELAAMADEANPRWEGALTSAVELFDPTQPDGFKGSPVMREMLLKQTRQRIDELDLEEVVSSRKAWSSVRWGLASCVLLAIPVFVAPSMYRQLWQRLLMPWGNWGTAGAWVVNVENGDRVIARGSDVELLATAERDGQAEPLKSLTLEWRDSAGTTDRRGMLFDEARKSYVALVPHVMRDFDFRIAVERQKTRDYKVHVVEPPVVTKIRLDVEPPAYAGWPAQSLDGAIGSIKVFEKSRLKFTLEFNKPVETAQLVWRQHGDANKKLELVESKQTAVLEVTADPNVAGPFLFALEDIHKLPNNDTVPRELVVMTDEAPKLAVKGDHSSEARPDDVVPIDVTASDDVGLGTLELHFTIENNPREPISVEAVRGQKSFEHRFTLDLSQLKVEHNQWLNYRVRITDERPEPGPHEVWSEPRVLRISKKAAPPGANELAKSHEQLRDELNNLRRDVAAKANEIQELRKEAAQENRKQDDSRDAEHVAQLQKQLHQLTERAEQLAQQLSQDPLFHELGEKAEQIAQNELTKAEAEVQQSRGEADQQLNKEQLDHLNQAEKQLDSATKQLAELEKPFDQLADLQKDLLELRRLSRQAEQLANRADELAKNGDSARHGSPDPAANQPEAPARDEKQAAAEAAKTEQEKQQLADQQKQLADSLNDLLKRRPELLAAAQRDQLDQLGELAKEARQLAEQQKELADALREQQAAAAERNAELAEKQQDLQKRAEAAAEKAAAEKPAGNEPKADKPATPEALQEAVAALKQGDLAEAQKQQQQAANELERLAAELQQAKANQSPLAQAARELANEQKKLADKAAEAQKSDNADERQQAAEQLKRDQAALNERIENLPQDKPAEAAKKQDEPEEDTPSVLELHLVGAQNEPQDIRNFGKTLGLDEPLIREDLLGKFDYANLRYDRTAESSVRQLIWNTSDSSKLFAVPLQVAARFEQDNLRGRVGQHLEVVSPGRETSNYPLYEVDSKFVKRLPFPLATLANEPNLGGLRPLPARLRDRVKELTQDSDGTPTGIARRLRDELRTRGGFQYMKRKEVEVDNGRPQDVEDFVFNKKKGHCEYFADALTSMLHAANIPARPVGGFKGGIYKEGGDNGAGYFDVREQHAHAWVEAFLDGHWVILDGTPGSGSSQDARQKAEQRGEQAAQALADGNLEQAAQEQRRAEQALRELAQQAAQPMPNVARPPSAEGGQATEPLAQLAEEQRQLAQEVAQALQQQRGEQPQPNAANEQANANNANQQPMPANAQQPAGENAQPNQPQPANAQQPMPDVALPPSAEGGQATEQQAREARTAQRELAQQAQELQKQVQQELGRESAEAKQAQVAAEQAQASQRQANSGQFDKAAESGEQAGKFGEKLAEQLQNNARANPELAQQAANLAEQQQAVAQQMEQLAQQPGAKNAAQQQRQQELNNAAGELGQQLAESQQRLGQQPLNLPQQAEGAKQAGQQAANSQQKMEAAQQAAQQGNANQAAQAAEQAAENLQQAAQQAQAAAERNRPPQSPIPRGVGEEVAEAAQRLNQAAQAQAEGNQPAQASAQNNGQPMPGDQPGQQSQSGQQPGQPSQNSASPQASTAGQQPGQSQTGKGQSGQSPSAQGQQGQGQSGQSQSGQGQPQSSGQPGQPSQSGQGGSGEGQAPGSPFAQMAQRLREAARALSDAANQSAPLPSQGGQPQTGQPSNEPNDHPQLAQGGGGNGQGNMEQDRGENLGDLQTQVKKMTGRNWGQLSSKLKTEMSQQAKHQAHGDYSKLIKLYFQEIAKTQPEPEAKR